jgi:protein phosphatase PTC7
LTEVGEDGLEGGEHCLSVSVGEDAYFLRSDSLGVADGVGGWSGHAGANPARWARKFMHRELFGLSSSGPGNAGA